MVLPVQITKNYVDIGVKKTSLPIGKTFVLAIFAGMFIALAGAGATIASATVSDPSTAKLFAALIFPAGLVMVLLAGSELFTGNCLIIIAVLEKKVKAIAMAKNLVIVFMGNFVGAMIVNAILVYGHTTDLFGGQLAQVMVNTAVSKCGISFEDGFLRGILCNVLVCVAVWVAAAATSVPGKIVALYLPIVVFVLGGFEHCVANMFYIPVGILAAGEYGIVSDGLTWFNFAVTNLIPVTLGNIVGGAFIVGLGYWFVYLHGSENR